MKQLIKIVFITVMLLNICGCAKLNIPPDDGGTADKEKTCAHREVTDEAVEPTCTELGFTEGSHCEVCGEVLVKQEPIKAPGHVEVIDEAVAKTCTTDGLTAGVHCSVCKNKIIEQKVIPASHEYGEWEDVSASDCFFEGEQRRVCSVCDEEDVKKIAKHEHNFVQDEETKLFSCEICNARILNGHLYAAFDLEVNWYDAYKTCDSMGGHLVTTTSDMEQNLITEIINSRTAPSGLTEYYYWAGMLKNTDGWQWITEEKLSYTHWGSQVENNSVQWYMGFTTSIKTSGNSKMKIGDWEDLSHSAKYGFICEWELDIEESEHFFTEWKVSAEASCYGDGERYRVCSHCGLEEREILPKLEHNFVFKEETGITACEHCGAAKYNGHIYKIFNVSLSWFDAYTYCDELGGHLATILHTKWTRI